MDVMTESSKNRISKLDQGLVVSTLKRTRIKTFVEENDVGRTPSCIGGSFYSDSAISSFETWSIICTVQSANHVSRDD